MYESILSINTSCSQKRQKEPHCVELIRPPGICEIQLIDTPKGGCCHCRVTIQQSYIWYVQCQWSLWHATILPWGILLRRIFIWRQVLVTHLLMPSINRKQTIKTHCSKIRGKKITFEISGQYSAFISAESCGFI